MAAQADDFFPYSDGDNAYWTGYFTSRSPLKAYIRGASSYLNAARELAVVASGLIPGFNRVPRDAAYAEAARRSVP